MACNFYILYSDTRNRYYIGHCCEALPERIRKHNSLHKGFTGKHQDWVLVYAEEYFSKEDACKRERKVKAWKSRKRIETLITGSEHSA